MSRSGDGAPGGTHSVVGSSRDPYPPEEVPMRGKQIAITAAIALVVVLGVKTYEAKKS
jgi:hypothetical protein